MSFHILRTLLPDLRILLPDLRIPPDKVAQEVEQPGQILCQSDTGLGKGTHLQLLCAACRAPSPESIPVRLQMMRLQYNTAHQEPSILRKRLPGRRECLGRA